MKPANDKQEFVELEAKNEVLRNKNKYKKKLEQVESVQICLVIPKTVYAGRHQ